MENIQKKNYTLPIAMLFVLCFMLAFVTNLQTPFADVVKGQFHLSNFQSLLGNGANFIAYVIMGLPAGWLLQHIGYKKTALSALAVGFIGVTITLFSGFLGSFAIYLTGAFISGCSMCMLNALINPMLNSLGADERKGNQLLLFGGVFNSSGATIAPVFAGILVGQVVNPQISDVSPALYVTMVTFVATFIALYFVDIPEPFSLKKRGETNEKKELYSPLSFRHFRFGMIAMFLYVGLEVGIQVIAYLYMTAGRSLTDGSVGMGMEKSIAGTIVGMYWFCMLLGRFFGGLIAKKFSSKSMLITVTIIGSVLVLLSMFVPILWVKFPVIDSTLSFRFHYVPLNVVFLVSCGLCTSVMWSSIFNLTLSGLGKFTGMASGFLMLTVSGGGVLPAFQGFVADKVGYMASYWVIFAAFLYIMTYAFVGYKNVNKNIPIE